MNELFSNISKANQGKLLKLIESDYFTFKKNVNVSSLTNDTNNLVIITSGKIQLIRNDYNGNRIIMNEFTDDDLIGSIIIPLSNQEYELITKEDTTVIVMDYTRIINYDENWSYYYQQFIKNLLHIITNKMKEKNDRFEILTKKAIRDKLLEYFKIATQKSGSKIIYLPYSFLELAEYLSVDRCAMSRELKYLKEEGFIKVDYRKITLLY